MTRRGYERLPVLVVDAHPIVADAIGGALTDLDHRLAVTVCHSASGAIDVLRRMPGWFRIFLDLEVPGGGLSFARQFHASGVADRCAIVTAGVRRSWIDEAKRLGMIAYLTKGVPLGVFCDALQSVLDGRSAFPEIAVHAGSGVRLTRRQRDVLSLVCFGHSTKEVATMLNLALGTVDNHIASAMRILGARNRVHAITRAIALGLIDTRDDIETGLNLKRVSMVKPGAVCPLADSRD
ncbi:TPA: LuxR C-terminal-related transcriptional regulator [Burkholderia cepacia]|uniref:response regulator transcription factor n=1 Tax=Burkholderia cepacia TaxID=292 RepID=UPI00075F4F77|nr:response regulator transcription factor [Burkholderia cepacia]HDR9761116.1 response regulator transcription factor [Burkholderia cepacia ATCC 25416]KVS29008.1 two-component system response regulator [Burkholderia cepacia]MCA8124677.1 response regulator transcription factor [Burkholderia cepacia]MCA8363393.1 response regulator transcription factor [Burkholderia cepacia]HDV6370152.1 response regulator transcription factor [Burkholderia cepacia]